MELKGFLKPSTLQEATNFLAQHSDSIILAGGTDLVIGLRRGEHSPEYIVDLGMISELKEIKEEENIISLGSMVTFSQLIESQTVKNNLNSIFHCAKCMGSPQIRNTATIGGNVANAGSAADIVPCLMSLDAELYIESLNGTRIVNCVDYFKNFSLEKIQGNEILIKIVIPKKDQKSGYYKLGKRNSLAIARVSAAVSLTTENNAIKHISISLGAVGRFPFRVLNLEEQALGKQVDWLTSDETLKLLENAVYESIKGRKTMPFKREAIKGVYKQALNNLLGVTI